jgi:hypothetical protein
MQQMQQLAANPTIAAGAKAEFDAMPGWKRAAVTAIDLPSLIAQGGSMGLLDKAAAAVRSPFTDKTYEEELANNRRQTEAARARQGWAGTAAELTGAVGGGLGLAKKGITAMSLAPKAGAAVRTALMGGEGAAYGAANAFGADEDIAQGAGMGALFGAGGSAVGDLVSGGVSKIAGAFNKPSAAPTLEKLNTVKEGLYDIAEKAGVIIKPEGMKHLEQNMIKDVSDFGFDAQAHPGAKILVDRIMRETADVAHRGFKVETAQNLVKRGNLQADRNITDTQVKSVKSQLAKINDPFMQWGRGYTKAEKEAAAKAAKYTAGERALHGATVLNPLAGGKLSAGGHIGVGAALLATGNLPGLALQGLGGLVGYGLGKGGEALAKRSVRDFVDLVARGGVPAPQIENAVQKMAKSKQDAVRRALMLGMNNQYNQPAER